MRIYLFIVLASCIFAGQTVSGQQHTTTKGGVVYDFTFADLAAEYLKTADTAHLHRISRLDAVKHIRNHAARFGGDTESTGLSIASELLSPVETRKGSLERFERNVEYAKRLARSDLPQAVALQYLPEDFRFSSSLYFTFGYDLGVAYGNNASVNLAHPHYLDDPNEIRYYSIHELHHAGFIMLKNGVLPSLDIDTRGQMARFIEYCTHLEGMATYAPFELRMREGAMNADGDYIALSDPELMEQYEAEFFEIYFHFKNNPDMAVTPEDWNRLNIMSDQKRLWYRVGALMAREIDRNLGREKLVSLIALPSEQFIETWFQLGE